MRIINFSFFIFISSVLFCVSAILFISISSTGAFSATFFSSSKIFPSFAFGISFQLPVILSLLARIGFVDSEYLKKRRKYVVVIIFAAAAILTPPDPVTQIGLAIPLLLLYELSIMSVKIIEKKIKEKEHAQY